MLWSGFDQRPQCANSQSVDKRRKEYFNHCYCLEYLLFLECIVSIISKLSADHEIYHTAPKNQYFSWPFGYKQNKETIQSYFYKILTAYSIVVPTHSVSWMAGNLVYLHYQSIVKLQQQQKRNKTFTALCKDQQYHSLKYNVLSFSFLFLLFFPSFPFSFLCFFLSLLSQHCLYLI